MGLMPGKGAHIILNEQYMAFLREALNALEDLTDEQIDEDPETIVKQLAQTSGWSSENDKFGKKAFISIPYKEGELRFTVVKTARGSFLDIREWYQPS